MDASNFPSDLLPLPTQPWDERPDSLPLTVEEARTALWLESGSVPKAAVRLKVTSNRLRNYIRSSPRLIAEQNEAREQLADRAEEIVNEALNDPNDPGRRDGMAKFLLSSYIGRNRGYGSGPGKLSINSGGGNIIVTWGDGSPLNQPNSDIIEGAYVREEDNAA
jgi:hypothetical protein